MTLGNKHRVAADFVLCFKKKEKEVHVPADRRGSLKKGAGQLSDSWFVLSELALDGDAVNSFGVFLHF